MLATFIMSFALTVICMPFFINFMKKKQFGQVTREEGPAWHQVKSGTPAMGGTIFIIAVVMTSLVMMLINNDYQNSTLILLFALIFFGLIGFTDDFLKIFKKQNEGLKSGQKFMLQIIGSVVLFLLFQLFNLQVSIPLPFIGVVTNPILVGVFLLIWIVGFSNAYNLTDGLDGLSGGLGIISFSSYAFIAFSHGKNGIGAVCITIVAGLLGFILFNLKPAKIFMGDVGSLALGAVLAVISILLGNPWSLLLIGLVYWLETASVILQVGSFKLRGKRIFKMSPLHHHYELSGWSEWRVVITFWLVGLVGAIVGISVF